jgi:hypothetical protein
MTVCCESGASESWPADAGHLIAPWLEYEAIAPTLFPDRNANDCDPQPEHCTHSTHGQEHSK